MAKTADHSLGFELDSFQEDSIEALKDGKSVIVCAPTGAGKTIIAEKAIEHAIAQGKKCFFTAPLKALINQKYTEFCAAYGEENVGIITGDTNKNRDAKVIVMTTEVYRNMLYGTTFGTIDPYLQDLQILVFDEFHYINDESRGTVWEESIIYSPKSVQVLGLSATMNNPEELVDWIEDIHGKCELVQTNDRPVPLHHFYFKEEQLHPLLTPNQKINPKLKERNDNRFGKRSGKFRGRSGGGKPATPDEVVAEMYRKDMLPAIYFVFSRKGCDSAARQCEELELLSKAEFDELNSLIDTAVKGQTHLETHPQLKLLRKGIAAHHAGLLPQLKVMIEELFKKGLIKVVFSTETLAAGINMPARTTVISSISKICDDGHRLLKPSEFLQMSGRAGRRGMDDVGYVITTKDNYQSAGEVAVLATSKPEDVESHFKASYEMVLNLLQNHSLDKVKDLIDKSFGQALANKHLAPLKDEITRLEDQAIDLQTPLCPGEIGDLKYYREMQDKLDQTRAKKKKLEKNMEEGVEDLEQALEILTLEAQNYPCNGCPKQKPCSKQMSKVKRARKQAKEVQAKLEQEKAYYWQAFQKIVDLLKDKNYIDENNVPTEIGKTCASIRSENSFLITEVLTSGVLEGLYPKEFAAVVSALIAGGQRGRNKVFNHASSNVFKTCDELNAVARRVVQAQRRFKVDKPVEISAHLAPVMETWADESVEWDKLMETTSLDDGDVLKGIRRTIDICKQLSKAPFTSEKIQNLAAEAVRLLEREPVLEIV